METKKLEDFSKGDQIKVDLYSRPNSIDGKYRAGNLGLDDLEGIKDNDIFFLETLRMKADLADKMIAAAEAQGKDTTDSKVMRELGEEINAAYTPLHRSEAVMTAVFTSFHLVAYYGLAVGIWGLVFKKGFLTFGIYGLIGGLLISILFAAPVVAFQRTRERVREMSFAAGVLWGNTAIVVGILGIIAWIVRTIFF